MTYPVTEPMRAVRSVPEALCQWCGIRLSAVPEEPQTYEGKRYHPGGCVVAARTNSIMRRA